MRRAVRTCFDGLSGRLGLRLQLVVVLLVVQISAHVLTLTAFSLSTGLEQRRALASVDLADGVISILKVVTPSRLASEPEILDRLLDQDARFELLANLPDRMSDRPLRVEPLIREALGDHWRDRLQVFPLGEDVRWPGPSMEPYGVALELEDGRWLSFLPHPGILFRTAPYLLLTLTIAVIMLPLTFLAIWAGVSLSAPIERLARGVDAFSQDINAPPIDEYGPREVRRATVAFNRMQGKLRKLIDDRARTLAAIGHDMRTPLTRLRLRLEDVDAGENTAGVQADLRTLERMIDDALRFMRAEGQRVDLAATDLAILCRTVCDDWADQGHDVEIDGPRSLAALCDGELMVRVMNNLIANAVTYAGNARVTLDRVSSKGVRVIVSDTGPGIPEPMRPIVLEPFSRLRSVEAGGAGSTEGFGLGLAISRELVARQGGTLTLESNQPQGLCVVVILPEKGRAGS